MRIKLLVAALVAALFFLPVAAAPIIAEGSASLDAGVTAAREMAIQDAMQQAALSRGAQVESAQYMNSGEVSESSSLSAQPLAGKVNVLNERTQDGLYRVRIQVDPSEPSSHSGISAARCSSPNGRTLRRRVITAYFNVDRPAEASDLDALGVKLPHELAMRLARQGSITARDAGTLTVMPNGYLADPVLGAAGARQLALTADVQFVVAGRIVSTAVTERSLRLSLFESDKTGQQQGVAYSGPFSAMTGGALIYRSVARRFDMELWIYDGLTGTVLTNQSLTTLAKGDVEPKSPLPFATPEFWRTDYGRQIDTLLDNVVEQVTSTLSCIPFSARVLHVENGRKVYLDAGGMDGLQVGDKLLVYRQHGDATLQTPVSGRLLGVPETLLGDVSVIQVQPNLSIAVVQDVRAGVQDGDLVRFISKR